MARDVEEGTGGQTHLVEHLVHVLLWNTVIFQVDETDGGEGIIDLLGDGVSLFFVT